MGIVITFLLTFFLECVDVFEKNPLNNPLLYNGGIDHKLMKIP